MVMNEERILRKVIITCAVTGAGPTPTMSPYLPITPKQISDDAVNAAKAGAAIVHVHARNPETGQPSPDVGLFREILEDIKRRCDAIVCITTGGAGTPDERIAVVPEFKPELATLNCGSLNITTAFVYPRIKDKLQHDWEHPHVASEEFVFTNTYEQIRKYAAIDKENDTKPEVEIWDLGQIGAVNYLLESGAIDRPVHLQFVMGSLNGIPATPEALIFMIQRAREVLGDFTWSVAAIGKDQLRMAAVTLAMGGHVRVGMEDSLFCGLGRLAESGAEQVERVVTMAKQLSIEPATPAETREMISLKGNDKVNF
jgi:uncharacterized protein (DUF849 family)